VKPAVINSELSGKWSSQKYVLPNLNRTWVFSGKVHDLLKLPTDQWLSQWMRVYKESLDDFRACSDWYNVEAGAGCRQAFLVAHQ